MNTTDTMTLQQKRRAMAEACPGIFTIGKNSGMVRWKDTGEDVTQREWLYAVQLVEGTLYGGEIDHYLSELLKIVEMNWRLCRANDEQRIDAFLKVKGLWRDGE